MNHIYLNNLTRKTGGLPKSGTGRQPALLGSHFLSITEQMYTNKSGETPKTSEKAGVCLEAYKQLIQEKISQMPLSATRKMESISVQISDAAFERMKNDPEYEAWVLNDLREAFSQTNPWVSACGGGYSVFYVGETKEECHAEGWYPGYMGGQGASMFEERSKGSFWERRMESHEKFMELRQKEAARRQMLMKLRINGGSVSAAELLLNLL